MLSLNQLQAITSYVDRNLTNQFCLRDLARLTDLSVFHFARKFKATTGKPPMRYVLERRVLNATCELAGSKTIAEIALDVGFSSQSHFTTSFKLVTGQTPCQWRRNSDPSATHITQPDMWSGAKI